MYKHREADLLFARMALLERLASPSQIQKAMGLLRRIAEAGGSPPAIGEVLIGEKLITEEQHQQLLARLAEANAAITEEQSGLHEVPRRVGRYELLERIGRGGMGAVYRARQLNMDRVVALKVLAPHLTRDAKYIKQFIREARAAGQINHANIVAVHEVGEADGHFFICMEHVEGRTLSRELLARGRLPAGEALDYAAQVAEALAAAEKAGIVHRDIKPDNLIRTPKGQIKVTDLGLAKRLTDVTSAGQTGWACGTPYYMAPEQARDSRKVDTRSDIYSLGATLYHLVTGKLPFEGDSSVAVLMRAATERLIPPAILCPEVPQPLSDLIERMMAREPEDRPQTAAGLLAEIAAVRQEIEALGSGRSATRRSLRAARSSRPPERAGPASLVLTGVWAVAALAVTGLIVELVVPNQPPAAAAPTASERRPPKPRPPLAPIPEPPGPDESARDAEMRGLFERLRAALDAPAASGWAGLVAECEGKLESAGRWRSALARARADLLARAESLAVDELERRSWLAAESLAWFRPAAALAELDGVGRLWPGTVAGKGSLQERAALAERAAGSLRALEPAFAAWLAAERFDRAAELLAALGPGGFAEAEAWKLRLAEARKSSEDRQAALRQERTALAAKLAGIEKQLAAWDFTAARKEAESALALLPRQSRPRRRLELVEARAAVLGRFRSRLCERLNAMTPPLADSRFAEAPMGMVVASADEKGLKLSAADSVGVNTEKAWAALGAGERLKLAGAVARPRSDEDLLGLGLLMLGAGRTADAARLLDEAEKFGAATALHREELAVLASGDGEEAAERLEQAARRKLAEGRPAEALVELGRLLVELRRTAWVAERGAVLEQLVESAERDCPAAGLFAARAREVPPGCLLIDYDFSSPRAALDWKQVELGDGPVRIEWLRDFAGEFLVRFALSGEAARAELVLAPRPDGSGAPVRLGRAGLVNSAGARPEADGARALAGALELEFRGGEFLWRTPGGAGRARADAALLEALAQRRVTGWHLALEMPEGAGQALAAHLECRLSEEQLARVRQSRNQLAEDQRRAAMRVTDPLLRAADLRRLALDYRDIGALAATAEMDRARSLLEANQSAEARRTLEEFMATYPSQSVLFPDARRLLDKTIGKVPVR